MVKRVKRSSGKYQVPEEYAGDVPQLCREFPAVCGYVPQLANRESIRKLKVKRMP